MGSAKVLLAAAFCLGLLLYSGVSAGTWEAELPGYWCDPYIVWGEHHEFAAIAEGYAYLNGPEDEITSYLLQHGGGTTFPADWTGGAGGSRLSQYTSGWYWVPDDPNDEPTTQDVTVECRHWKYDREMASLFVYVGTGTDGSGRVVAQSNVYVDPQDEESKRQVVAVRLGRGSLDVALERVIVELEVEVNATDDEVMVTLENLFVWECEVDENWAGCDIEWGTWAIIPQPVEE